MGRYITLLLRTWFFFFSSPLTLSLEGKDGCFLFCGALHPSQGLAHTNMCSISTLLFFVATMEYPANVGRFTSGSQFKGYNLSWWGSRGTGTLGSWPHCISSQAVEKRDDCWSQLTSSFLFSWWNLLPQLIQSRNSHRHNQTLVF